MTGKKDVYCGGGKLPAGKRIGTKKECVDAKQVRLYGVEKITREEIEKYQKSIEKMEFKLAAMNIKLKTVLQKYNHEENPKEKAKLAKKLKKGAKDFTNLREEIRKEKLKK